MFDSGEVICLRLTDIKHHVMEHEEKEIGLVTLTWELNPFTASRAQDLDGFLRSMLYTRTDAEVNAKLRGATFDLSILPQKLHVRMAPDQTKESFTILEAKVGTFHARRSKKSTEWRLVFTTTCSPASDHQLAQIADAIGKHRYVRFEDAAPDLFSEVGEEAEKTRAAMSEARPH